MMSFLRLTQLIQQKRKCSLKVLGFGMQGLCIPKFVLCASLPLCTEFLDSLLSHSEVCWKSGHLTCPAFRPHFKPCFPNLKPQCFVLPRNS